MGIREQPGEVDVERGQLVGGCVVCQLGCNQPGEARSGHVLMFVWFGMWEFVWWMWRLSRLGGVCACGVELCMISCEGSQKLCVCDVWRAMSFGV